jgi:hypothetical protein
MSIHFLAMLVSLVQNTFISCSVQIEEYGGTAISFSADVSMEADVESMMRAVSFGFALSQRIANNLLSGICCSLGAHMISVGC